MSHQEFQSRVRAYHRLLLPFAVVVFVLMFAGPFGLFGVIAPPFRVALRTWLGMSRNAADSVCLTLMFFCPVFLLLSTVFLVRRCGLFCPKCGPWTHHVFFIKHVTEHGTCPKCKCQIIDA